MAEGEAKQFRFPGVRPDRRAAESEEDPLVELARIVSEDGGFYSTQVARSPQLRPVPSHHRDRSPADLEAELMQELENSLQMRGTRADPTSGLGPEYADYAEHQGANRASRYDQPYYSPGQHAAQLRRPVAETEDVAYPADQYGAEDWREAEAGYSAGPAYQPEANPGGELANVWTSPVSNATEEIPAGADTDGEWLWNAEDVRHELRTTFGDFGEVPRQAGTARRQEPQDARTAQRFEAARRQGESSSRADAPAAAGRSASRRTIGKTRRPRRGLVAAASVLAVVAFGGAVAAYLQSTREVSSAPPPVISADAGAVKIAAQESPVGEAPRAGDVVYNRAAVEAEGAVEQIVDSAEEPREVARVVLPPSGDALAPPPGGGAATGQQGPGQSRVLRPIGPRKVRTVVVRPDGTIVASSEAPAAGGAGTGPGTVSGPVGVPVAGTDPVGAPTQPVSEPDPLQPRPVRTTAITSPIEELSRGDDASLPDETAASSEAPAEADLAVPAAGGENPAASLLPRPRPRTGPGAAQQVAFAATEQPQPAGTAESVAVQSAPDPGPAETAALGTRPPAPSEASTGGYVVQLSSQRSEAQARASFAALQARHAAVLGRYQANIQQADLGAKGTYFRVRVGPWANRGDAIQVCEALKAAGGSCFVSQ